MIIRLAKSLVALLLVATTACGSLVNHLPRLPDGRLDVAELVTWAEAGIEADCALGFNQDICTYGRRTIAAARAIEAGDEQALVRLVRESLVDSAMRWPMIADYVQWLIDLLGRYVTSPSAADVTRTSSAVSWSFARPRSTGVNSTRIVALS